MIDPYIMLQSSLGLFALVIFWYCFWKDYVVDKFRQDVFSLRNDLFLDTATGKAPFGFESHEYRKTVEVLNVSIRCIENFNVLRLILARIGAAILAPGRPFDSIGQEGQPISSTTSDEAKKYLREIQCIHGKYTMRYLFTISPTFILIVTILLLRAIIIAVPRSLNKSLSQAIASVLAKIKFKMRKYSYVVGELTEISAGHEMIGRMGRPIAQ